MRRWSYILQETAVGLRRNLSMTVAVILAVSVSVTLFGASVLLRQQVQLATDQWIDELEVAIFLCDDAECSAITPAQQQSLQEDLENHPLVAEVTYESKDEAYARFLELFEGQPHITAGITAETMPASFRVKLTNPQQVIVIKQEFEARPGVEGILDQQDLLTQFFQLAEVGRWSALGVAVVAMVAATLLVGNTVRMAAVARREQIQIMKLVGASNGYIRLPFVMEGVLAGLAGALVAWALLLLGVPYFGNQVAELVAFLPLLTFGEVAGVWPWLVVPAVAISGTSSIVALWGFLDI